MRTYLLATVGVFTAVVWVTFCSITTYHDHHQVIVLRSVEELSSDVRN